MHAGRPRGGWWRLALLATTPWLGSCQLAAVVAENYRRESTRPIAAEYRGLEGRSFAVVVTTDRATQGEHPNLLDYLTLKLTERLSQAGNVPAPSGYVPAKSVLAHLYAHPSWTMRTRDELARELGGVERLVVVEVHEYRLNDPGNRHVWEGRAAGTIAVYDPASITPESPVFEKGVSVAFPDQVGVSSEELAASVVNTELSRRFVERAAWFLHDHEEPYYPKY